MLKCCKNGHDAYYSVKSVATYSYRKVSISYYSFRVLVFASPDMYWCQDESQVWLWGCFTFLSLLQLLGALMAARRADLSFSSSTCSVFFM